MSALKGDAKQRGQTSAKRDIVKVKLQDLPSFSKIQEQVRDVIQKSSLWDRHGVDWTLLCLGILGYAFGFYLLSNAEWRVNTTGLLILGLCHALLTNKCGHLCSHGALFSSIVNNDRVGKIMVEFLGSFSYHAANEMHIKYHHPHTNIVGLGDSSSWKAPQLSRGLYLFVAPLFFPLLIPLVSLRRIWGQWQHIAQYIPNMLLGTAAIFYVLMALCGYKWWSALFCFWFYRSLLAIPFIHVNVFQHIGLTMFSAKNRPARIYQMSYGVLNLSRNTILDYVFGHSLINCHVEHHLFPRLSDNMCLKIKPIVSKALQESGLPYNEESYRDRLLLFWENYDELMVDAPPVTHFVGLQ